MFCLQIYFPVHKYIMTALINARELYGTSITGPPEGYNNPAVSWAAAQQNQQNYLCAQRRLRSAWASAQTDQSLCCPHVKSIGSLATQNVHREDSDLSLHCVHRSFCWFCRAAAQLLWWSWLENYGVVWPLEFWTDNPIFLLGYFFLDTVSKLWLIELVWLKCYLRPKLLNTIKLLSVIYMYLFSLKSNCQSHYLWKHVLRLTT